MNKKTLQLLQLGALLVGLFLLSVLIIDLWPTLEEVVKTKDAGVIQEFFWAYGFRGVWILTALQGVQVIVSVFPSLSIQVAAGLSYGPFWGAAICIFGLWLGNSLVYFMAKSVLHQFDEHSAVRVQLSKFENFMNHRHKNLLLFLAYLLPILPNGIKPYLAVASNMEYRHFTFAVTVGSILPVMAGTWAGNLLMEGNLFALAVLGIVTALICLLAVCLKNKF